MKRSGNSLLTEPPIPPEKGVRLMVGDLERGRRFGKAVLHFVVYRAESTRAVSEALLEARLRELGFRIERVRLPLPEEPDWPYWLHFHPPDGHTVFFVYDLRKAFPEILQDLNYRREIFVEQQVRAVFWVLEEEAREVALKAPDFWAFRGQVLEFLEVPPPRERAEVARELAWWGWHGVPYAYESPQEIEDRIALRERLLAELGEEDETAAARAELHYTLGGLYWARREYEAALEHMRQALALAQRIANERLETWAWHGLGIVYDDLGRHDEALGAYRKAIELDPKDAYLYANLADVYVERGRDEEAIELYKKSFELQPRAIPRSKLGYLHLRRGELDKAVPALEEAIQLDPNAYSPLVNLGIVRYRQGEGQAGAELFRRALELCTGHDLYDRLSRAWLRVVTGEVKQGLEEMRGLLGSLKPPAGLLQHLITNTELLVQAPQPPEGVEEMLELLRETARRTPVS